MPFFTDSPSYSSQKKVAKGYWKHRIACKTGFSRHPVLSGFRFVIVGLNFHAFSYFFYKEFSNTLSCVKKKKWLFPFQKLSKISLSSFLVDHWSNLEFSCFSHVAQIQCSIWNKNYSSTQHLGCMKFLQDAHNNIYKDFKKAGISVHVKTETVCIQKLPCVGQFVST